jgi:hypothetical protein
MHDVIFFPIGDETNQCQTNHFKISNKKMNPSYHILQTKMEGCMAKSHAKKDSGFIWVMWQKALIINVLKTKASNDIDKNSVVHDLQIPKTIIRRFWECC